MTGSLAALMRMAFEEEPFKGKVSVCLSVGEAVSAAAAAAESAAAAAAAAGAGADAAAGSRAGSVIGAEVYAVVLQDPEASAAAAVQVRALLSLQLEEPRRGVSVHFVTASWVYRSALEVCGASFLLA